VCDLPTHTYALPIAVACADAMLASNRRDGATKTMRGGEDPPVVEQGSTATPTTVQKDLVREFTRPCIPPVDDLDHGVRII